MDNRYLFKAKVKNWKDFSEEHQWIQWNVFNGCPEAIDESTICHCTGLLDSKKNLIWENDVVKVGKNNYLVWWDKEDQEMTAILIDEKLGFNGLDYYSRHNTEFTYHDFTFMIQNPYSDIHNEIEVIDSIYNNPELLLGDSELLEEEERE